LSHPDIFPIFFKPRVKLVWGQKNLSGICSKLPVVFKLGLTGLFKPRPIFTEKATEIINYRVTTCLENLECHGIPKLAQMSWKNKKN